MLYEVITHGLSYFQCYKCKYSQYHGNNHKPCHDFRFRKTLFLKMVMEWCHKKNAATFAINTFCVFKMRYLNHYVITSYSIHYTKLYEKLVTVINRSKPVLLFTFPVATIILGALPPRPAITFPRITSYNVCYTKLLR